MNRSVPCPCPCPCPRPRRIQAGDGPDRRPSLLLSPLLGLLALGLAAGGCKSADREGPAAADPAAATAEVVIPVEGMVCGGCEDAIEEALGKVAGVAAATASHTEKRVVVRYDAARVTPAQLEGVITGLGYTIPPPSFPAEPAP